jgi:hypothetical protein
VTAGQWKVTIGVLLLILFIIGIIGMISYIDSKSRREQGLPKKKHNHEK